MFSKLYNSLKKQSEEKSLKEEAKKVFVDDVKKRLSKDFNDFDDTSDVSVNWDESELKDEGRSVTSDYSIDIDANGGLMSVFGYARLSTTGQYSCMTRAYRVTERGDQGDLIGSVNIASRDSKEFINNLVVKVETMWNRAFPNTKEE